MRLANIHWFNTTVTLERQVNCRDQNDRVSGIYTLQIQEQMSCSNQFDIVWKFGRCVWQHESYELKCNQITCEPAVLLLKTKYVGIYFRNIPEA